MKSSMARHTQAADFFQALHTGIVVCMATDSVTSSVSAARWELVVFQHLGNLLGQAQVAQLHGTEVHRHAQVRVALAVPLRQGAAGHVQHQFADLVDQAQFFGQRDEVQRRDPLPGGVFPAHQCLESQHLACGSPAAAGSARQSV
jgi:hypothetical protein